MFPATAIATMVYDVLVVALLAAYEPYRYDWKTSVDFRTLLCLVCKEWRNTVYDTAIFWSSVPITLATPLNYLNFHLERTQSCGLSVLINLRPFRLSSRPLNLPLDIRLRSACDVLLDTVQAARACLDRFQHLTVEVSTPGAWQLVALMLSPVRLAGLRRLSVKIPTSMRHFDTPAGYPCSNITLSLPNASLGELRLAGAACATLTANSCGQLTVLRLIRLTGRYAIPWSTLLTMLKSTVLLRILQLSRVDLVGSPDGFDCSLPSLTTLELSYTDAANVLPIARLALPAVTNVRVSAITGHINDFAHGFRSVLQHVRVAEIYMRVCTPKDIYTLVLRMPALTWLDIAHMQPFVGGTLLEMLATGKLCLPALRELTLGQPLTLKNEVLFAQSLARKSLSQAMEIRATSRQQNGTWSVFYAMGSSVGERTAAYAEEPSGIVAEWPAHEDGHR
ncbi:hypothetical protein C8R47DRAFT_1205327 [Mycena vitilis]|nr:hypothetical protein C8R47DRAFT_1205327 [Mycena vitilis]